MKNKKILAAGLITVIAAAGLIFLAQTSYASSTQGQLSGRHLGNGNGAGTGNRLMNGNSEHKDSTARQADRQSRWQAVDAAISAGDYNAWLKAVGTSSPMASKINASNFPKLIQAHELRQQADAIMAELGLERGNGYGMFAPGQDN